MTATPPMITQPPSTSQLNELATMTALIAAIAKQEGLDAITQSLADKGAEADKKLAEAAKTLAEAQEIATKHETTQAELDARLKAVEKEEARLVVISQAVDKREAESTKRETDLNRMIAEFEARQNEQEAYLAKRSDDLGVKEQAADEKDAKISSRGTFPNRKGT